MITRQQIRTLAPNVILPYEKSFATAGDVLPRYGITTGLRLAHFMAQVLHESGQLRILTESLNYSVDGLLATFGTKRVSRDLAAKIGRTTTRRADQEAIAEAVYGGTWGAKNLGNSVRGDGWRYRGHGLMQLTGRANFRRIGRRISEELGEAVDLEQHPELTYDPRYALHVPCIFWKDGGCNELADADDVRKVTKAINGGYNGLDDRRAKLAKTKAIWLAPAPRHDPKCAGVK